MGLFGSLFGAGSTLSKQKELEKLINDCILTTLNWENNGEPTGGELIANAATTIRINFPKIIDLFQELAEKYNSRNLHMRNTVLPSPFPNELSIPSAIKGIIDYSENIESRNPSLRGQIISPDTLNKALVFLR